MIRKAEKNNIEVEFIDHVNFDVTNYYNLLVDTFKRQKTVLHHPKDFFLSLLKEKNRKYVFPVIAKLGEKTVSAAIILRYEDTLFYLSGVSTHEGNQLSANSLIQWKIISFASDNGFNFYDMGGLGIPSIDKFKMSFGGNRSEKIFFVQKSNFFKKIEPIAKLLLEKGFVRFR
jgi:lipid II:glycine glycyltransferase (peptidoglycan interpeptide bridge formation enzyme)